MTKYGLDYPTLVEIYSVEGSYSNAWPPENGLEFLQWIQNHINQAPEEYRDKVLVEFGSKTEYDSSNPTCKIYYSRPATQEEISKRKRDEKQRAKSQLDWAKRNYDEALNRTKND